MNDDYNDYSLMFKALSDMNRILIVDYLMGSERCACEILEQLNISQSTLSYHMKLLTESNIVIARKEGKWMYYSLNNEVLETLNQFFTKLLKGNLSVISKENCDI